MFTPSAYTAWLDSRAAQAFEKVAHQEAISNEETLVLILKAQSDQLRQLAEALERFAEQVDKRFEQVDKRFEQVDKRFEQVERRIELMANLFRWGMVAGISFLSLLMAVLKIFSR
jgi:vacuolar-type H+-ATPase subunit I/STV1